MLTIEAHEAEQVTDGFEARERMIHALDVEANRLDACAIACRERADTLMALREDTTRDVYEAVVLPVVRALRRAKARDAARAGKLRAKREELRRFERVPNAPLRARFENLERRGLITASDVARRAGLLIDDHGRARDKRPDTTYALRLLGLRAWPNRAGYPPSWLDTVKYDQAVTFANALGMTYQEAGV